MKCFSCFCALMQKWEEEGINDDFYVNVSEFILYENKVYFNVYRNMCCDKLINKHKLKKVEIEGYEFCAKTK